MTKFLKIIWRGSFRIGESLAGWFWRLFVSAKFTIDSNNVSYIDSLKNYDGVPLVIIIESDGKVNSFRSKLNIERANESARKLAIALSSPATNWEKLPGKSSNLKTRQVY